MLYSRSFGACQTLFYILHIYGANVEESFTQCELENLENIEWTLATPA